MGQYKHKKTGNVVFEYKLPFQEETVYAPEEAKTDINHKLTFIPKWVVEGSSDWEQIKEVLLVTEDNVEIFKGQSVYGVRTDYENWKTVNTIIRSTNEVTHNLGWKWFSSEEKRKEYMKYNEPRYSLFEVMTEITRYNVSESWLDRIQSNLIHLKNG